MAKRAASATKMIGFVLVVTGLGLAYWGHQLSGTVGSQIAQAVTGSVTDRVLTYYIGAAASFVVGAYLLIKK
ncbi:MAG TPA: DUF3185 family protein [Gallionellaceae bacterium]|nr:DUF3185 family protein [Gallionellaceae bacterium]